MSPALADYEFTLSLNQVDMSVSAYASCRYEVQCVSHISDEIKEIEV